MHACTIALLAILRIALAEPPEPATLLDDPAVVYRMAAAQAGKGADAHMHLAVWCESRGLTAEYQAELAEALRLNPDHAGARGLCGMIKSGGKWVKPADLAGQVPADPARADRLAAYYEKRAAAGDTAQDHLQLAAWCLSQGLKDESQLHLSTALRREPAHPDVRRRLGYKLHEGHWVNEVEEARAKHRFIEARDAHHAWAAKVIQLAHARVNPSTRAAAEAELATVYDPNAAPAIWSVFIDGGNLSYGVQLFRQIEGPEATSRIALLAMGEHRHGTTARHAKLALGSAPLGNLAVEALGHRDPREYIGPLIHCLRPPLTVEVRPIDGPGIPGAIFANGVLQQEFPIMPWLEYKIRTAPPVIPQVDFTQAGPTLAVHGNGKGKGAVGAAFGSHASGGASFGFHAPFGTSVVYHAPDPLVMQAFTQAMANPAAVPQIFAQFSAPGYRAPAPVVYDVIPPKPSAMYNSNVSSSKKPPAPPVRTTDQVDVGYELYVQQVQGQLRTAADKWDAYARSLDKSAPAYGLLKTLTGRDFPLDAQQWEAWWKVWNATESIGNAAMAAPPAAANPAPVTAGPPAAAVPRVPAANYKLHYSRLAEGTLVWTDRGRHLVEDLKIGDRVLTQEPHTGALSIAPIVDTTRSADDDLVQLAFESGGTLNVTPSERIWVATRGWVAAGLIKPGDDVRSVKGRARVTAIQPIAPRSTHNVFLLDANSLFAGDRAVLVHDNSIVRPPSYPFDAVLDIRPKPVVAARPKS